jgi:hypothetical protein
LIPSTFYRVSEEEEEAYKAWRRVSLPELDLSEEDLTGLSAKVESD